MLVTVPLSCLLFFIVFVVFLFCVFSHSEQATVRVVEVASCDACSYEGADSVCETTLKCGKQTKGSFCNRDPGAWADAEMELPPAAVFGKTACDATTCCCPKTNSKVVLIVV